MLRFPFRDCMTQTDRPIDGQADLERLCADLARADFVAVDTEFMRDQTYWPRLCLIQVAGPDRAAAIDPLADGIDLAPFIALLHDPKVLKVFHAGRQDLEIFYHLTGEVPAPVFDTQVAAMVCGFGESVAYDALVQSLAGTRLDKASRFTDWSERPLSEQQLSYALADVVHLRAVYTALAARLEKQGRRAWVDEEHAVLASPETYRLDAEEAWRRLKPRTDKPRFLAVLRAVAGWREREAQRRDVPRNRVLRDDVLLNIAALAPTEAEVLKRSRGLPNGFADSRHGRDLIEAVREAKALPAAECPRLAPRLDVSPAAAALVDMLRVLLKFRSAENDVAARVIATTSDLEQIAVNGADADVPALHGWRRELFGEDALALCEGRVALGLEKGVLRLVPFPSATAAE